MTNFMRSGTTLLFSGEAEPKLKCGFDITELHRAEDVAEKSRVKHKSGSTFGHKVFKIN